MIGDNLLIYNPSLDMFYAGRNRYYKVFVKDKAPPRWVREPSHAKCSNKLTLYKKICAELGGGVRIVSETEARRIVRMRKYREARDVQQRTAQAEPTVLSFAWALPKMRGIESSSGR